MAIREMMHARNLSIYKLSKESSVPYATCHDIVNGKTQLEKCSAETVYKIAQVLQVSMESLLAPYVMKRCSFENFKSTICHRVKEMGDLDFIKETLESHAIQTYFDRKWYPECLYLLAMLDYLCRENNIPLYSEYNDFRQYRLEKTIYPSGVRALSVALKSEDILKQSELTAIPEFLRFNIVENEVRNVI